MVLAWCAASHGTGSPELNSIEPVALPSGVPAVIEFRGKNLEGARVLWSSWLSPVERWDAGGWQVEEGRLRVPVYVPDPCPDGIEIVRVLGTNGVSNPLLVLIDGLRAEPAPEDNSSIERAQPIAPPVAIDGLCHEARMSFYRVALGEGEHLAIEVVAHRLGWSTDPVLRVLDGAGRELAYVNDSPGLGSDCALDFRAAAAGDYVLEIRDAEYAGGRDRRYRLRVGRFPVAVLSIVPCMSPASDETVAWESTVSGRSGMGRMVRELTDITRTSRWSVLDPGGENTLTPRVLLTKQPAAWESEPNDTAEDAFPLPAGSLAYGRFGTMADTDWFRVEVAERDRWRFEARSRSMGLPCDPILRLIDEKGTTLATSAGAELDPAMHHRFDAGGTYFLALHEAAERSGPGRSYVLMAEPGAGGFEFSAESDRLGVPAGGEAKLKLTLKRKGHNGPIHLSAAGLADGFTMVTQTVEAEKKEADLVIRCDSKVPPGTWCQVRLEARANEESASMAVQLDLYPALRKSFPEMLSFPPGFAGDVWICAVAREESEGTPAERE
jgi:hypothetical protein